MEDTLETIAAMLHQEHTGYDKRDWLRLEQNEPPTNSCHAPLHIGDDPVDVECRTKMVTWCIQVVDFCKFSRETVEIAMSHLDRYVATPAGATALRDRAVYQLASMASLYTAVKIHEPEAMDPTLVSNLSRGAYSPKDVEAMEASLLMALKWRVNPPTSLAFCRKLMDLIPQETMDKEMRQTAYDLTKFQTELAVHNYQFVTVKPSTIAYCSLMNSLESLGLDDKIIGYLGMILSEAIGLDCNADQVVQVQSALYSAVLQQPVDPKFGRKPKRTAASSCENMQASRRMSIEVSPRSISVAPR